MYANKYNNQIKNNKLTLYFQKNALGGGNLFKQEAADNSSVADRFYYNKVYYLITPNSLPTLINAAIALSKCSCS